MRRYLPTLIALLALAILAPSGRAHAEFNPIALGDEEHFGWALLTRDGASMSTGILAWETLKKMKSEYGPELLVIADQDERYVITDPGLIREAQRAHRKIRDMEPEIGELAEAQARLSLGQVNHGSRERLERRLRTIEKAIQNAERDGEATEQLEQELFEVRVGLQVNESMERQNRLTAEQKRDLIRRRDKGSERVSRGMSRINAEVREILARAKSRHLARRVD
jgi:signal recognition particle GTPase